MTEEVNYSVGQLLEAINNKADLDGSNLDNTSFETFINSLVDAKLGNIDYVIESKLPTDEDPTWYRLYKSGWVEQGGVTGTEFDTSASGSNQTITLMKPFVNTNYTVSLTMSTTNNNVDAAAQLKMIAKTTTSFMTLYSCSKNWIAYGQGA